MYRIIFFGSSQHSVKILSTLAKIKHFKIVGVVTKPDKPLPNPVSLFAQKNKYLLLQPTEFDSNFTQKYTKLKPDLVLVVAYGPPYFSDDLINIPQFKVINIHPSALPFYRGATPGPWQIINGETNSAVTFFQIDSLPDHGPIVAQIPFEISKDETAVSFYEKAFSIASKNLEIVLKNYLKNPNILTPQNHNLKTYFPRFTKDSAKINWQWPAEKIEKFIRAMLDWPIAWTEIKNKENVILKMQIFSSELENGKLSLKQVQIEGKKKTYWTEIKNYYEIITN